MELSEESTILFALCFWSRKMIDFGVALEQGEFQETTPLWMTIKTAVVETWSPTRMFTYDHLVFVLQNMVSIGVCFVIGHFGTGMVVPAHSSKMAATLAVLLIQDGSHRVDLSK